MDLEGHPVGHPLKIEGSCLPRKEKMELSRQSEQNCRSPELRFVLLF